MTCSKTCVKSRKMKMTKKVKMTKCGSPCEPQHNWLQTDNIFRQRQLNHSDTGEGDYTGWSLETVKNYLLITRTTKQPVSWNRCIFVHQTCTFWYLVSKDFNSFSVIIFGTSLSGSNVFGIILVAVGVATYSIFKQNKKDSSSVKMIN